MANALFSELCVLAGTQNTKRMLEGGKKKTKTASAAFDESSMAPIPSCWLEPGTQVAAYLEQTRLAVFEQSRGFAPLRAAPAFSASRVF